MNRYPTASRRFAPRAEPLDRRDLMAVLTVNTIADNDARDDALTLREAIEVAQGDLALADLTDAEKAQVVGTLAGTAPDTIAFHLREANLVSAIATPLPVIRVPIVIDGTTEPNRTNFPDAINPGITLEGTNAGTDAHGLVLAGGNSTIRGIGFQNFGSDQLVLQDKGGNRVVGDDFTRQALSSTPAPGGRNIGVINSPNNTIGGAVAADGNRIKDSPHEGIAILGAGSTGNVIQGNVIGGTYLSSGYPSGFPRAVYELNQGGILIAQGADGNTVGGTVAGAGNRILVNTKYGVSIDSSAVAGAFLGNAVLGNQIVGNAYDPSGSPRIDAGSARVTPAPTIAASLGTTTDTTIIGALAGTPGATYRVEVFAAVSNQDFLGLSYAADLLGASSVTIGPDGVGRFSVMGRPGVAAVSATATPTSPAGNTSAYSPNVATTDAPADLTVAISSNPATITAPGPITYTYAAVNLGRGEARNVVLAITLPLDVTVLDSYNAPGSTVTFTPQREFYDGSSGTPRLVKIPATLSVPIPLVTQRGMYGFAVHVLAGAVDDARLLSTQASASETTTDPDQSNNSVLYTPGLPPATVSALVRPAAKAKAPTVAVSFSTVLGASATNPGDYRIVAAGRDRKFGTRDDIVVRVASARVDASGKTVTLVPRKRLNPSTKYQIFVAGLTDSSGRAIQPAPSRILFGRASVGAKGG